MTIELPTLPDPRSAPPLRWGIIGTGGIAARFAREIPARTDQHVVAVASRELARARAFAAEHRLAEAYGDLGSFTSSDIDVVYVASPHSEHRDHALAAIAAGKHVLVEKAFTRNAAEAEEVFEAARSRGVFAMEAMWTRFLPHMVAIRSLLDQGALGQVVGLSADHGQKLDADPAGRLLNPALAGGALLDLGVYPLAFALDVLGAPETVQATGALAETGVDAAEVVLLGYPGGVQAVCTATLRAKTPTTAAINGTRARVEIEGDFYAPASFSVVASGQRTTVPRQTEGGFQYQVAEVARRVTAGESESPLMSWQHTLDVQRVMDEVRRQLGVVYPGE